MRGGQTSVCTGGLSVLLLLGTFQPWIWEAGEGTAVTLAPHWHRIHDGCAAQPHRLPQIHLHIGFGTHHILVLEIATTNVLRKRAGSTSKWNAHVAHLSGSCGQPVERGGPPGTSRARERKPPALPNRRECAGHEGGAWRGWRERLIKLPESRPPYQRAGAAPCSALCKIK